MKIRTIYLLSMALMKIQRLPGLFSVGGQNIIVPILVETPAAGTGYAILTITYEYVDDANLPTYNAELSTAATIPAELVDEVWSKIIVFGSYKYTAPTETESSLDIVQAWTGGNVNISDRTV